MTVGSGQCIHDDDDDDDDPAQANAARHKPWYSPLSCASPELATVMLADGGLVTTESSNKLRGSCFSASEADFHYCDLLL